MEKLYVTYSDVHNLVAKAAADVKASLWEPDLIVAIASGGFIPARIFKTFLKKDIYVVGLKRYPDETGSEDPKPIPIKVQWIDEVERKLKGKKILLVDEVDDTRITLAYCVNELLTNHPAEIRVAVLHQKDKPKLAEYPTAVQVVYEGALIPDVWIKYPWDALDLSAHEAAAAASK
ncbi:phosphoribosyltransferase [Treponema sp.]